MYKSCITVKNIQTGYDTEIKLTCLLTHHILNKEIELDVHATLAEYYFPNYRQ